MEVSTYNKTIELPLTIDKEDLIHNLWKVISVLKPHWEQANVKHKVTKVMSF